MNYTNMILPELVKLLRKRKLGNVYLYNELNKLHGVPYLPPQQEKARQEAIKLLETYDEQKLSFKKVGKIIAATIGIAAGIATIYAAFKS